MTLTKRMTRKVAPAFRKQESLTLAHLVGPERDESTHVRAGAIVLVLVVALLAIGLATHSSLISLSLWVVMVCTIVMPVCVSPQFRDDAFHPYSYFAYVTFFSYALGALLVMLGSLEAEFLDQLPVTLILLSAAFLGYWIGYRSKLGVRLARSMPLLVFDAPLGSDRGRFWITLLLLYVVGWAGRIQAAALGYTHLPKEVVGLRQWSGVFDYLHTFSVLSFAVIVYLLMIKARTRRAALTWIVPLTGLEVVGGMLDGGRTRIVLPLLYVMIAYSCAFRPIRWRTLILTNCLAFVVLAPVLTIYRDEFYSALSSSSGSNLEVVIRAGTNTFDDLVVGGYSWKDMLQTNIFDSQASIVNGSLRVLTWVPSVYPFQHGNTFIPGLLSIPIPRFLWPAKPVFMPGRDFAVRFWGFDTETVYGSSTGIGMPAEAYYNFGWAGMLLFPFLGIGFRFCSERYDAYRKLEPIYIVRLVFVLMTCAELNSAFLYFFGGLLQSTLIYFVLLTILNWRLPRPLRIGELDSTPIRTEVRTRTAKRFRVGGFARPLPHLPRG